MQPYRLMALNNAWANARLYGALRGLSAAAFTAARPGFFPSLAATLNHIHEVDLYYLDALERGGAGRAVYDRPEIDEPAALAETRVTARADGAVTERVDALLLHLFQHQIHHRGQAHVQVQHAGIAPPQLDEFYLDYDRHPTAAPYHR